MSTMTFLNMSDDARGLVLQQGANPSSAHIDLAEERNAERAKNFFDFISRWSRICRLTKSDIDDDFFERNLTWFGEPVTTRKRAYQIYKSGLGAPSIDHYFKKVIPLKEEISKFSPNPQYFIPAFSFSISMSLLPLSIFTSSVSCLMPGIIAILFAFCAVIIIHAVKNIINGKVDPGLFVSQVGALSVLGDLKRMLVSINWSAVHKAYPTLTTLSIPLAKLLPILVVGILGALSIYVLIKLFRARSSLTLPQNALSILKNCIAISIPIMIVSIYNSLKTVASLLLLIPIAIGQTCLIAIFFTLIAVAIYQLISHYKSLTSMKQRFAALSGLAILGTAFHDVLPSISKLKIITNYGSNKIHSEISSVYLSRFAPLAFTSLIFGVVSNIGVLRHTISLLRAKWNSPSQSEVKTKLIALMPYARKKFEELKQLEEDNNLVGAQELRKSFWFRSIFYLYQLDNPTVTSEITKTYIDRVSSYPFQLSLFPYLQFPKNHIDIIKEVLDKYAPETQEASP